MSDALAAPSSVALPAPLSPFRQFYVLTKPKVVQLIVFCAVIGMLLAVPGVPTQAEALRAVAACAGIWLVAGAAAAFNCLIEQGIDARMKRTAWRPTARGELSRTQTLVFSGTLCAAGMLILGLWVNLLTMWLTQKMTPAPGMDPLQRKMMMAMPKMVGVATSCVASSTVRTRSPMVLPAWPKR